MFSLNEIQSISLAFSNHDGGRRLEFREKNKKKLKGCQLEWLVEKPWRKGQAEGGQRFL
jgi:hypothetical protein